MDHIPPPLLIHADANSHIGTGHVMRCLALAQAWQAAGGQVIFITACESEALRRRLIGEKLEVVALSDPRLAGRRTVVGSATQRLGGPGWLPL